MRHRPNMSLDRFEPMCVAVLASVGRLAPNLVLNFTRTWVAVVAKRAWIYVRAVLFTMHET